MIVTVTQDDIDHGVPCIPEACALALAFRRQVAPDAKVGITFVRWGNDMKRWELPREACDFRYHFDNRQRHFLEPLVLEIKDEDIVTYDHPTVTGA